MKNINERYTHKELRSIYKDAKYNWPNNCEPMSLAVDEEKNNSNVIGNMLYQQYMDRLCR